MNSKTNSLIVQAVAPVATTMVQTAMTAMHTFNVANQIAPAAQAKRKKRLTAGTLKVSGHSPKQGNRVTRGFQIGDNPSLIAAGLKNAAREANRMWVTTHYRGNGTYWLTITAPHNWLKPHAQLLYQPGKLHYFYGSLVSRAIPKVFNAKTSTIIPTDTQAVRLADHILAADVMRTQAGVPNSPIDVTCFATYDDHTTVTFAA